MKLEVGRLSEVFRYNDGKLYWRIPHKSAGSVFTGTVAGHVRKGKKPYVAVKVYGRTELAHRIIFAMHHGYMPDEVDHIDGDSLNNRVENLRECTRSQNSMNRPAKSDNVTGLKGVSRRKRSYGYAYRASIWVDGKSIPLGVYKTPEEAHEVYKEAAKKHFGEFYRDDN